MINNIPMGYDAVLCRILFELTITTEIVQSKTPINFTADKGVEYVAFRVSFIRWLSIETFFLHTRE